MAASLGVLSWKSICEEQKIHNQETSGEDREDFMCVVVAVIWK
jgi:hypothetical protein